MEFNVGNFFDLAIQRESLSSMSESASEDMKPILEEAIYNADLKIAEIKAHPKFKESLETFQEEVDSKLLALEALWSAVKTGLIDESVVAEKESEIKNDPRLQILAKYQGKIAVAHSLELDDSTEKEHGIDKINENPLSHEEEKNPKIKVALTIQGNIVRVGAGGRLIRLSSRSGAKQRDYSEYNEKLLRALVTTEEDSIGPRQLWELAFPERDYDQSAMTQFRHWNSQVTYRKERIFIHNRKTGNGSAYSINKSFDITIIDQKITKKIAKLELPKKPVELNAEQQIDFSKEADSSSPELLTPGFPLSLAESVTLAAFIGHYATELQAMGIEPIEPTIINNLTDKIQDQDIRDAFAGVDDPIERRRIVLEKITLFAQNDDSLYEALDLMDIDDPRLPLLEYICLMDTDEDRWKLINAINEYSTNSIIKIDEKTRTIKSITRRLPDGMVISSFDAKEDEIYTPEVSLDTQPKETISDDMASPLENLQLSNLPDESPLELSVLENDIYGSLVNKDAAKETGASYLDEDWAVDLMSKVDDAIQRLFDAGILTSELNSVTNKFLRAKRFSGTIGTAKSIDRLASAGIIKNKSKNTRFEDIELQPIEVVIAVILNSAKSIFENSSKSAIAKDLIKDRLDEFFSK
jgi:hypothetical protein